MNSPGSSNSAWGWATSSGCAGTGESVFAAVELARKAAARLGLKWEEGEILSRELGWSHLQFEEFDVAWGYLDQAGYSWTRLGTTRSCELLALPGADRASQG